MEFVNYQHDLDSHEYEYKSEFELDVEEVNNTTNDDPTSNDSGTECWKCGPTGVTYKHMKNIRTSNNAETREIDPDNKDDEDMIEAKDSDLSDQKYISVHHNGMCLMQTAQELCTIR